MTTRFIRSTALVAVTAGALLGTTAYAKNGADDKSQTPTIEQRGGHGADNKPGDDRKGRDRRGGRRNDDVRAARHGADDKPGDDRGGRNGRGGKRNDDIVLT
ncbi:MAG: hypothetical protein QOK00_412 [Thermoleophilaceae bacterium]|nr:hypothetical protein [Thermoleophilaceae bacterium]